MTENRLIYVAGTPSGGTSAVAGALHHLGVDMGELHTDVRPYPTYEDKRAGTFKAKPSELCLFISGPESGRDFRGYIDFRLRTATGPIGLKVAPIYWMSDPEPETLPLAIVKVDRPLEDSIRSDWEYVKGDLLGAEAEGWRAARMGGFWWAKEELCRMIPPRVTVEFYELLREPAINICALASALDLRPSDEQFRAAREFVK